MLHGQQKCHHIVYIIMDVPDHLISIINIIIKLDTKKQNDLEADQHRNQF